MTTVNQTLTLEKLNLVDGDFIKSEDWFDLICEDGGFTAKNQYITFNSNGNEVVVDFDLSVSGKVTHDRGDYWTPPYTDVDIKEIDLDILSVHINDWEVELNGAIETWLVSEIKKNL